VTPFSVLITVSRRLSSGSARGIVGLMEGANRTSVQAAISAELMVPVEFDAAVEVERRVTFLVEQLAGSGLRGWVLGVSGGVDSAAAGRLCQLAAERVRADGGTATFVAMRLPYHAQADEEDAQRALAFVRPDATLTMDVGPASDALSDAVDAAGEPAERVAGRDLVRGNLKARMRMAAQYAVAGAHGLLVVGTDHAAEAVMGFFTKYGDGACDLAPLAGLTKRRVRAIAQALGAEDAIVAKVPTADLESERPGLPDEDVFGVTYQRLDDFLEGDQVAPEVHEIIVSTYRRTAHKRALPATP
jgi:NAD+ synthase